MTKKNNPLIKNVPFRQIILGQRDKKELKNVKITELTPYLKNPRKNDKAVQNVVKSLKEYGLVKNSIVVDENLVLITGHTTLKAIKSLGWKTVPEVTQVFGLTDTQKKGYRIADNKTGETAEWDDNLLLNELENLDVFTGFDIDEIEKMQEAESPASIDELLEELDIRSAIEKPVWVVVRLAAAQIKNVEPIISQLKEVHIERSYTTER